MSNFELNITDAAVTKIKQVIGSNKTHKFLRVEVTPGGCQGFSIKFIPDSTINESDISFIKDGITVVSDEASLNLINGSTLEYTNALIGSRFLLKVKESKATCGCGTSFSI